MSEAAPGYMVNVMGDQLRIRFGNQKSRAVSITKKVFEYLVVQVSEKTFSHTAICLWAAPECIVLRLERAAEHLLQRMFRDVIKLLNRLILFDS